MDEQSSRKDKGITLERLTLKELLDVLTVRQLWAIGSAVFVVLSAVYTTGYKFGSAQVEQYPKPWPYNLAEGKVPEFLAGMWTVRTGGELDTPGGTKESRYSFDLFVARCDSCPSGMFIGAMYTPSDSRGQPQLSAVEGRIATVGESTNIEFNRTFVRPDSTKFSLPQIFKGTVFGDRSTRTIKGSFYYIHDENTQYEWEAYRPAMSKK